MIFYFICHQSLLFYLGPLDWMSFILTWASTKMGWVSRLLLQVYLISDWASNSLQEGLLLEIFYILLNKLLKTAELTQFQLVDIFQDTQHLSFPLVWIVLHSLKSCLVKEWLQVVPIYHGSMSWGWVSKEIDIIDDQNIRISQSIINRLNCVLSYPIFSVSPASSLWPVSEWWDLCVQLQDVLSRTQYLCWLSLFYPLYHNLVHLENKALIIVMHLFEIIPIWLTDFAYCDWSIPGP